MATSLFDVLVARDGKACALSGTFSAEMGEERGDLHIMRRNPAEGDRLSNLVLVGGFRKEQLEGYLWWIGYMRGFVVADDPARVPFFHRMSREWVWVDDVGGVSRRARVLGVGEAPSCYIVPNK